MKRLLFVFNPHSGKGQIKNHLLAIIDTFVKAGYNVEVYPTQKRDDAREKVIELSGSYDLVVCSGGDGTVNEVVSGMIACEQKVPIGYIPAGSTNDFGRGIKIPKKMKKAADIAVNGQLFPIDMGRFNDRTFVYVAAFGAFTQVSYATSQSLKNMLGHQAYIIEGAKQLTNIKAIPMKFWINGELVEDEFIFGMITNAKSVGGFKGIAGKHVRLDDGLFEVTLIKKIRNPLDLNSVLSCLVGKNKKSERVVTYRTDFVKAESEEEVPWVLDGEYGGEQTDVEIQNQKQIVTFKVGKPIKQSKE